MPSGSNTTTLPDSKRNAPNRPRRTSKNLSRHLRRESNKRPQDGGKLLVRKPCKKIKIHDSGSNKLSTSLFAEIRPFSVSCLLVRSIMYEQENKKCKTLLGCDMHIAHARRPPAGDRFQ